MVPLYIDLMSLYDIMIDLWCIFYLNKPIRHLFYIVNAEWVCFENHCRPIYISIPLLTYNNLFLLYIINIVII